MPSTLEPLPLPPNHQDRFLYLHLDRALPLSFRRNRPDSSAIRGECLYGNGLPVLAVCEYLGAGNKNEETLKYHN